MALTEAAAGVAQRPRAHAEHPPPSRPGPLDNALARANAAQNLLHLTAGRSGPGWLGCAQLLAGGVDALGRWRAELAGWLGRRYGEAPDRAVDGYLLTWYLAAPARLAALLWHTDRLVPSLRPADLAIRFERGRPRPDGVAVLSAEFACLAGDPAAGDPRATVLADESALAALLRERFAAHAAEFVAAVAPRVRFGRRTLWAAATDALDEACWHVGRHLGAVDEGVANAALVLPGPAPLAPFTSASTMRPAPEGWTRRRESCCFHYVLAEGIGPCATCPRLTRQ